MSDFDFDEIDKAVAGALTPDSSDANQDTHNENEAEQTPERIETQPPQPKEEKPTVKPVPAARRSAGRFMDVVHPSSDMRSQSSTPSFTPPNRTPKESGTPEPTVNESDETQVSSSDAPLESPFLPDAKVEKRPLGGFAGATAQNSEELEFIAPLEDELLLEGPDEPRLEAHTMPDPIDFAAHASALPSENEDTGAPQSVEEEVQSNHEEEPVLSEEPEQLDEIDTPEVPVEAEGEKPIENEPTGPASISQQYTEQPSSAPSSGAIYDTENYHAPLAPVPKKRSGVWTFIWILLLVILGAGAGVAFYLFVLPMF